MCKFKYSLILALVLLAHLSMVHAAETDRELRIKQTKPGISMGIGLQTGSLAYRSDTVQSDIGITAIPQILFAADFWPVKRLGFYGDLNVGTGAKIDGVFDQQVSINTVGYKFGAKYRWFLGDRSDAIALGLGLGLNAYSQFAQEQRPSVLLERHIIGPGASGFITLPWANGDNWLRITLRGDIPFFVRESPNDTGNPSLFYGYGANSEFAMTVSESWATVLQVDYSGRTVGFDGPATRAAGTGSGQTQERFLLIGLYARFMEI
ncbi:MAG: hypothetical protein CMH52_00685 [Myxococcales bacterium]|nr:hypothetical protein [Myxococcales bacterium]